MMTEQQMIDLYHQAKASGMNQKQAVYALMDKGASVQAAANACWLVETKKRAPSFGLYADGREHTAHEARMLRAQEEI